MSKGLLTISNKISLVLCQKSERVVCQKSESRGSFRSELVHIDHLGSCWLMHSLGAGLTAHRVACVLFTSCRILMHYAYDLPAVTFRSASPFVKVHLPMWHMPAGQRPARGMMVHTGAVCPTLDQVLLVCHVCLRRKGSRLRYACPCI